MAGFDEERGHDAGGVGGEVDEGLRRFEDGDGLVGRDAVAGLDDPALQDGLVGGHGGAYERRGSGPRRAAADAVLGSPSQREGAGGRVLP